MPAQNLARYLEWKISFCYMFIGLNYNIKTKKDNIMYLCYVKDENVFYVSQYFGYALSDFCDCLILKEKIIPTEINLSDKNNDKDIFKYLNNIMIMQSHYIENLDYYKKHEEFRKQFIEEKDKEEKAIVGLKKDQKAFSDYCKKVDEEFEIKCFECLKERLEKAKINIVEEIFELPFLLDGKQLAFRKISPTLSIYENGVENLVRLPVKKLVTLFIDGKYVHVEPASIYMDKFKDLKAPLVENSKKNKNSEGEKSFPELFKQAKNKYIEDSFELGLLKKKIK